MQPLSLAEKKQIETWGLTFQQVENQINNFITGFPFLPIVAPAVSGNGVVILTKEEVDKYVEYYQTKSNSLHIVKFVPASGAASRMFKELFEYLENDSQPPSKAVAFFLENISLFAFYKTLLEKINLLGKSISSGKDVIETLLLENGMQYGNLPKGALEFHRYDNATRTPIEEHFVEGALYASGKNKITSVHFTVSPEFQELFETLSKKAKEKFEREFNATFEFSFSQQKKSTDTIAVSMDNTPFVEDDGTLLFRPAGHGALLENLNDIDADIIFIKNIDNVVPDRIKAETVQYKKALAGILLSLQEKIFKYVSILKNANLTQVTEIISFAKTDLNIKIPNTLDTKSLDEKIQYLRQKLDRPIRVCGMVKNTGEPGGGPFWVKEKDGSQSLQIAESVQIDPDDVTAQEQVKNATHFNPVDLVCGVRSYSGTKFDLLKFSDPSTGFITKKSKNGRELKAQELPGLWNGAMANWITIFVDVPLITFNPVKTVNDLLRPEHQ